MDAYQRYKKLIAKERLPIALVDLDALDHNIETLLKGVREKGKKLRLASKSIRSVALLKYIVEKSKPHIEGIMSYCVEEAAFLVEQGFKDILIAYPSLQSCDGKLLAKLNADGARVSMVVDCQTHFEALNTFAKEGNTIIPIILEIDLSLTLLGGSIYLGVRRSPLREPKQIVALACKLREFSHLKFLGIMGYEAQVAGIGEKNPFSPWLNFAKKIIKNLSVPLAKKRRAKIVELLKQESIEIEVFNGGGTGSLIYTNEESWLTEVTAGSGFVCSHLFDYYPHLGLKPALLFAIQAVRNSNSGFITCLGGGFVASGEIGKDRLPVPFLPTGVKLTQFEAVGEVQTPLKLPSEVKVALGDPIFFRHAKAGELAEHFNEYIFVRGDKIIEKVPTYRGFGKCFL